MRDKTDSSAPNDFITATMRDTPTRIGRIGSRAGVAMLVACGFAASLVSCSSAVRESTGMVMFVNFDSERGREVFLRFDAACRAIGLQDRHHVALQFVGADVMSHAALNLALRQQLRQDTVAIIAPTSPVIVEASRLTQTVPIVFVTHQDPVDLKVTASLVHRPSNLAGISYHLGIDAKMLELLREAAPGARRFGYVVDLDESRRPQVREFLEQTSRRHGIEWKLITISSIGNLGREIAAAGNVDAWFVTKLTILDENRDAFVAAFAQTRRPIIYPSQLEVLAGGPMSYEAGFEDPYGALAGQLDRVLSGVKPSDIPIDRPKRFRFVLNVKAARAAGIHLSPGLLARADRVI
jgi:putative ABC transport system substrate-binding protein